MTAELLLLLWSLPLYALYLGTQAAIFRLDYGIRFAAGARDTAPPESQRLGRAERALKNFLETWPAFIILALVAHLAGRGDALVFWGGILYLVARLAYLPLYVAGTYGIRSLVWNVASLGLLLMAVGILF